MLDNFARQEKTVNYTWYYRFNRFLGGWKPILNLENNKVVQKFLPTPKYLEKSNDEEYHSI